MHKTHIMASNELKKEIAKVLDTIPDEMLEDVLSYLKLIIKNPKEKIQLTSNIRQIIDEDKELLQRLAQ